MYAVTGITGQVGTVVAQELLKSGETVRAVVRDADKAKLWIEHGCDMAIADIEDADALTRAFEGATSVFLMSPPNFDPAPGFPQIQRRILTITEAVTRAKPRSVVFLSTVGAHVTEPTLLTNSFIIEQALRTLPVPTVFLRAAWFMENAKWDIAAARDGTIPTFLQPLDHPIPMIATADIGRTAADLLRENWKGNHVVELEAESRYSANDIGTAFAAALGQPVHMKPIPRTDWENLFRTQGMKYPTPRMRMLDGFNEGWIDFEGTHERRHGKTSLETVIDKLVD